MTKHPDSPVSKEDKHQQQVFSQSSLISFHSFHSFPLALGEKVTATVKAMKRLLFSFALFKPEQFNVQLPEFIFCFPYFSSYAFKFKLTNAFVYNFKPSPSLMHQYLVTLPLISLFAMLLSAAWNCQGTKQPNFSLISQKIDSFMNCLFTYAP